MDNGQARARWSDVRGTLKGDVADGYRDEARIAQFREFVYHLRVAAGLTQAALAARMGTTQSAIARMEGGGVRPTLETFEKLAAAVGADLVVGVGENLSANEAIATLEREGRAVVRRATG